MSAARKKREIVRPPDFGRVATRDVEGVRLRLREFQVAIQRRGLTLACGQILPLALALVTEDQIIVAALAGASR
jgi:hypothetical protein